MIQKTLIAGLVLFALTSCESYNDYNSGYNAGRNGKKNMLYSWSSLYNQGYQAGQDDADAYDNGYYDGYNGNKCRDSLDRDYREGFEDGKRTRKSR